MVMSSSCFLCSSLLHYDSHFLNSDCWSQSFDSVSLVRALPPFQKWAPFFAERLATEICLGWIWMFHVLRRSLYAVGTSPTRSSSNRACHLRGREEDLFDWWVGVRAYDRFLIVWTRACSQAPSSWSSVVFWTHATASSNGLSACGFAIFIQVL